MRCAPSEIHSLSSVVLAYFTLPKNNLLEIYVAHSRGAAIGINHYTEP